MNNEAEQNKSINLAQFRRRTLGCVSGLAIIVAGASNSAAQVATDDGAPIERVNETSDSSDTQAIDEIVTTGSRIAGTSPAAPVVQISRAEIDARGLSSVEDIIRYIPQNFSSVTAGGQSDGQSGLNAFFSGSTTVNLRGLGEGSTLVLVNGKRIAASPSTSDTSFTDISTIPFGAIERVEVLTDGASAVYGSDAVGGVINFILRKDYRGAQSQARYEHSKSGGHAVDLNQTLGMGWNGGNLIANLSYRDESAADRYKAGLSDSVDFSAIGGGNYFNNVRFRQPGQDGRDGTLRRDLTPESEQWSGYISVFQDLSDTVTVNLSGQYAKRESSNRSVGHSVQALVFPGSLYNPGPRPRVGRSPLLAEVDSGAIAPLKNVSESERYSLNASVDWVMPIKDWELSAGYSQSADRNGSETIGINPDDPAVVAALASNDPNTALNLFGDGSMQRADLASLISVDSSDGSREGQQSVFNLDVSGTAIDLPAGPVKFSVGGEIRTDGIDYKDFRLNPVGRADASLADFSPESENQAVYAELFVPVFKDRPGMQELSLTLAGRYDNYNLDGPFDGFDGNNILPFTTKSFDSFSPKAGVIWRMNDDIKLRGTWGEGFQIASLTQLFDPRRIDTVFQDRVFDPLNPASNPLDPNVRGNQGIMPGQGGPGFVEVPFVAGGNPDLEPQTSTTFTLGADVSPSFIEGLEASFTYSNTEFEGLFGNLFSIYGGSLFGPNGFPLLNAEQFPGLVERDASGVLTFYDRFGTYNLASRKSETLDFNITKRFENDWGDVQIGTLGTHILSLEDTAGPVSDPREQSGSYGFPSDWNVKTFVDWSKGDWSASAVVNYSSSYDNEAAGAVITDVDSYTTLDLTTTYAMPKHGWRFTAGVNNLFDADFPFVDVRAGYDSTRVDLRRRVFFIDVTKEFDF